MYQAVFGRALVLIDGGGFLVDDLLAQQQVVIKSLETNYKPVDGISGATILGNGSVALILDISGLIAKTLPPLNTGRPVKAA